MKVSFLTDTVFMTYVTQTFTIFAGDNFSVIVLMLNCFLNMLLYVLATRR